MELIKDNCLVALFRLGSGGLTDIHSVVVRSKNMKAIRSKDTKPEILLRKWLHSLGFRYRLHVRHLPGKPDLVMPKYKVAIFVHGCFWHKHDCHLFKEPRTRRDWWLNKLLANRYRDLVVEDTLRERGWRVAVIWECALKGKTKLQPADLLFQLTEWIGSGNDGYLEVPEPRVDSSF